MLLALVLYSIPRPGHPHAHAHESDGGGKTSSALKVVYAAAVLSMVVFFTAIVVLPNRLQQLGFTEAQVGYLLSFVSLVAVGAAGVMPVVARRIGERGTLVCGFVFYVLAHLAFVFADSLPLIVLGAVCLGIGFGLTIPLLNHMTIEQSCTRLRGRNLANLDVVIFSGQFLSSFVAFMPGAKWHGFACALVLAAFAIVLVSAATKKRGVHAPLES